MLWVVAVVVVGAGTVVVTAVGGHPIVLSLGVAPLWRRRKIAQELLRTAIDETVRRELPSMVLEVAVDNDPAAELYHTAGFVAVGRRARYYSRPDGRVDAVILRLAVPRSQ